MVSYRTLMVVLSVIALTFFGCVKETYFGKSTHKKILYFTVAHESGTTVINQDSLIIRLNVSAEADLTKVYPDSILLSTYASISPRINIPQNFTAPVNYTVTAEDGSTSIYKVIISKQSANPQINNSNFNSWYMPTGKNYKQPGADKNTEWATGNDGVVSLGTANTTPVEISAEDLGAQMVTKDLGIIAQITKQRMAAATLFTGSFTLDISNPLNSPKFGIPFTARPKSFTVDYKYTPGSPYKNGSGQTLDKKDSCDIYLLLENRSGSANKRIATAWFRSGVTASNFTNITIPLTYGALASGTPTYQLPANGQFGLAEDPVTHITIVFSSSAYGDKYEGGVNSTLIVNNLLLNY